MGSFFSHLVIYGFPVGLGDQSEFLPYAMYIKNPSLFEGDLFMQSMEAMKFNERYFFARFFAPFSDGLVYALFVFDFLFSLLMLAGILTFVRRFIDNGWSQYLCVVAVYVVLYTLSPGGNELKYADFQGSNMAAAFGVWALHFALDKKWIYASLLCVLAVFFQVMIGLQLFLLVFGGFFAASAVNKDYKTIGSFIAGAALFCITAGVFAFAIKEAQETEVLESVSDEWFLQTAFYFRLPHHFIPAYFKLKSVAVTGFLFICALIYYRRRSSLLFYMHLVMLAGTVVYILGLQYHSLFITATWWFRTTIWIKLTGATALAGLLSQVKISNNTFRQSMRWGASALLVCFLLYKFFAVSDRLYAFVPGEAQKIPEVDVCIEAGKLSPQNAVFIVPFSFTGLKYYGERSVYAEFKAVPRRRDYLKIWHYRINELYGVNNRTAGPAGFELKEAADAHYKTLSDEVLLSLKNRGVTHAVLFSDRPGKSYSILYQNAEYKVVKL